MRKIAFLSFILVIAAITAGGCVSINERFVDSMQLPADILLPDLKGYYEADESLDQEQKDRRIRLIEEWRKNIESAGKKETGMSGPPRGPHRL